MKNSKLKVASLIMVMIMALSSMSVFAFAPVNENLFETMLPIQYLVDELLEQGVYEINIAESFELEDGRTAHMLHDGRIFYTKPIPNLLDTLTYYELIALEAYGYVVNAKEAEIKFGTLNDGSVTWASVIRVFGSNEPIPANSWATDIVNFRVYAGWVPRAIVDILPDGGALMMFRGYIPFTGQWAADKPSL
ncbi:MAG: hypothetical protein FWE21_03185 [Defluviitaleaceae bacterium]|nr:hypothetical protein [Defluviitaleaceae bacterium]